MRIDKSQIKPILEGQTGREVADNLQLNFEYLADKGNEIDSDVAQKWGTAKFGGILEGEVTVLQQSINDLVTEENVFFYKDRFVFQKLSGFSSSYYSNALNGSTYNEDGDKAKSKTYFVFENKQYYFNGTDLVLISVDVDDVLSATSTNAVQNKAVSEVLLPLKDKVDNLKTTVDKQELELNKKSLKDIYISYGAKYNDSTGYYEMNEITDLTEADMFESYVRTANFAPTLQNTYAFSHSIRLRTNFKPGRYDYYAESGTINLNYAFIGCGLLETVNFEANSGDQDFIPKIFNFRATFHICSKLRKVIGVLDVAKVTDFFLAFGICTMLEELKLKNLNADIQFQNSPKLSKDSILYMIQNSIAESPITITLHPTAYTMAMADNEIQTALGEKTNVSLVDGGAK